MTAGVDSTASSALIERRYSKLTQYPDKRAIELRAEGVL